jgi:hypothetical protein
MNSIGMRLNFRRRFARLAAIVLTSTAAWLSPAVAQTSEPAATTPPYALFQYATLTGSNNTINATWLPVVSSTGTTSYVNVTLQFKVSASGALILELGYPKVVPAPTPLVSSFIAGNYVGPSNILSGNAMVTVAGPGITIDGSTEWSLATSSGANGCTYPDSATWYVGPIANSPLAARLQAAGITSTDWSYGVGDSPCGGEWPANSLLGFSQIGNSLTIVNFTQSGKDYPMPVDQIVYTLKQ